MCKSGVWHHHKRAICVVGVNSGEGDGGDTALKLAFCGGIHLKFGSITNSVVILARTGAGLVLPKALPSGATRTKQEVV